MDVVMLNSKSKYKTSKNKGDDIIHVRVGHIIGGGYPKDREKEERRHRGDRHGDGLREPPCEHPCEDAEHVPAGGRRWSFQLNRQAYNGA